MANLCAEALGDQKDFTKGERTDVQLIRVILAAWRPIFPDAGEAGDVWHRFTDELARLEFGDEPVLLAPAPRRNGQHEQLGKLTLRRMEALRWAAFLKARGVKPRVYQPIIAEAFGSPWDTIRKWPSLAARAVGEDLAQWWLNEMGESDNMALENWYWRVLDAGDDYRAVIDLPLYPREKFPAFLEKVLP